jgi:hypothetical protein
MADFERTSARVRRALPAEPLRERRLAYEPETRTLVLGGIPRGKHELPRLYYRKPEDSEYTNAVTALGQLITPAPGASLIVTTWILGWGSRLFFTVGEAGSVDPNGIRSVLHRGLVALSLSDNSQEIWESLHGERPDLVMSELIGSRGEDHSIFAVVGFRPNTHEGSVDYQIARISWLTGSVEQVAPLNDIFF